MRSISQASCSTSTETSLMKSAASITGRHRIGATDILSATLWLSTRYPDGNHCHRTIEMPRPLRYHPSEWAPVFVTNRCFQSRMLLKPSSRLNQLVVGIIARAQKMYEVKLYGLCMMSNHYHMLLAPKNAQHLASLSGQCRTRDIM